MKLGPVRRALAAACLLPLLLAGCSDAAPTPEIPDPTTSRRPRRTRRRPGRWSRRFRRRRRGMGRRPRRRSSSTTIAIVDYAQATGDTERTAKLGLQSCEACDGGAEFIDESTSSGGAITGGDYTVDAAEVTGRRRGDRAGRSTTCPCDVEPYRAHVTGRGRSSMATDPAATAGTCATKSFSEHRRMAGLQVERSSDALDRFDPGDLRRHSLGSTLQRQRHRVSATTPAPQPRRHPATAAGSGVSGINETCGQAADISGPARAPERAHRDATTTSCDARHPSPGAMGPSRVRHVRGIGLRDAIPVAPTARYPSRGRDRSMQTGRPTRARTPMPRGSAADRGDHPDSRPSTSPLRS